MRDPPVFGTSAETTSAGRSRPEAAQIMLRQAVLIAFASSAAMALQPSNLQTLQRGLHTRLAASSRRRTKFTRLAVYTRLRRPMNPRPRSKGAPSSEAPSPPSSRPSRPPQSPQRAPPTSTTRRWRPTSRRSSRATRTRARPSCGWRGTRRTQCIKCRGASRPNQTQTHWLTCAQGGRLLEAGARRRFKGRYDPLQGGARPRRQRGPRQGRQVAGTCQEGPPRRVLRGHLHAGWCGSHQGGQRTHYRVVLG